MQHLAGYKHQSVPGSLLLQPHLPTTMLQTVCYGGILHHLFFHLTWDSFPVFSLVLHLTTLFFASQQEHHFCFRVLPTWLLALLCATTVLCYSWLCPIY